MRRIDAHAHVAPQPYIDLVPAPGGNLPKPPVVTAEQLLAMMERYAIDAAVISTGPPGAFFGDQGAANETARLANEEIAAAVAANRDRFAGLAPAAAARRRRRAERAGARARHHGPRGRAAPQPRGRDLPR